MIHYDEIVKLSKPEGDMSPTRPEVDEALYLETAKRMATQGYRFTESTARALEHYLRGGSLCLWCFTGDGYEDEARDIGSQFYKVLSESLTGNTVFAVISPAMASYFPKEEVLRFFMAHKDCEMVIDGVGRNTNGTFLRMLVEVRRLTTARTHFIYCGAEEGNLLESWLSGLPCSFGIKGYWAERKLGFDLDRSGWSEAIALTNTFNYRVFGLWTGNEPEPAAV